MRTDERGLTIFADFTCQYGTTIRVKESSAGSASRIWLFMQEDRTVLSQQIEGMARAHLTFAQAKKLIKALETAMAEHYQVKA